MNSHIFRSKIYISISIQSIKFDYFQKVLSFCREDSEWCDLWSLIKNNRYEYAYELLSNRIKQGEKKS